MKLGWVILNISDKLWVQVLTCNYLKETDAGPQLARSQEDPCSGEEFEHFCHDLRRNCQQNVRNGKDTLFWPSR
ncbi:hypothetical protein LINPERPRIM_LOCUS5782, partial [Linum perenne]